MCKEDGPLLPLGGRNYRRVNAQVLYAICSIRGAVHDFYLDRGGYFPSGAQFKGMSLRTSLAHFHCLLGRLNSVLTCSRWAHGPVLGLALSQ